MRVTSTVEPVNQAALVRLDVPTLGRSFALRTDWTSARTAAYRWRVGDLDAGASATVAVAGRETVLTADEGGTIEFVWDGLDSDQRPAAPGLATLTTGERTLRTRLGRWDPAVLGLGGLTVDAYHHLDVPAHRLYLGSGRLQGRVDARTDEDGFLVAHGHLSSRFDRAGRHLRVVTAPEGRVVWDFDHDGDRLVRMRDRRGGEVRVEHADDAVSVRRGHRTVALHLDGDGRVVAVRDPSGRGISLEYSPAGLVTRIVDASGFARTFDYDEDGRLVGFADPGNGRSDLVRTATQHGHKVTVLSAEGRESTYRVETLPDGTKVRGSRCCGAGETVVRIAAGRTEVHHPDGTRLVRERATTGNTTRRILPSGLEHVREAHGDRIVVDGHSWVVDAGPEGTASTSPEGRTSTARRTDDGMEVTLAGHPTVRVSFDVASRSAVIDAGSGPTTLGYDDRGRVTSVGSPGGDTVGLDHDDSGWLVAFRHPDGRTARFEPDGGGVVRSVAPPGREPTRLSHHDTGILAGVAFPGDERVDFVRDRDGLLVERRVAGGSTVAFRRGPAGEVTDIEGSSSLAHFEYRDGRVVAAESADGILQRFTRDGPVVTAIDVSGPVAGRVGYEYGDGIRFRRLIVDGLSIDYRHDRDGLVVGVGPADIVRDAAGRVTEVVAGVVRQTHRRDAMGRPLSSRVVVGDVPVWQATYGYDPSGRITSIEDEQAGGTRRFGYDRAGRLVEDDGPATTTVVYDDNGCLVTLTRGDRQLRAVHDRADRLVAFGDADIEHGPDGGMTATTSPEGVVGFRWDDLGRLVGVDRPDGRSVAYLRDAVGSLAAILVDGAPEARFLLGLHGRPVATLHQGGAPLALFGHLSASHPPLVAVEDGREYVIVADHVGSVRLVIDVASGDIVERRHYGTWGATTTRTGPAIVPYGFAGGLDDPHSGLVHFPARTYHPGLMRWLSRDPLLFLGGSFNLYAYADGDPVNHRDPTGRQTEPARGPVEVCRAAIVHPTLTKVDPDGHHMWIRTPDAEVGMGYDPIQGEVLDRVVPEDHTGAGDLPGSECDPVEDVDLDCVNRHPKMQTNKIKGNKRYGESLGYYVPGNTCQNFVDEVLSDCSGGDYSIETDNPDVYDKWYGPDFSTHRPAGGMSEDGGYTPDPGYTSADGDGTLWE